MIHDLHNFQTRNADISKALEIPPTTTNLDVLDTTQDSPQQQGVQCSIEMSGVMIAPVAFMFYLGSKITNDETVLEIQILYGNFNFFNNIAATNIDSINWADLALDWTVANVLTASQNTTTLSAPITDWLTRGSRAVEGNGSRQDINQTGFFIFAKEIINRIVTDAAFTAVYDANLPSEFSTIGLACPMSKFVTVSDVSQISLQQKVLKTAPQAASNATARVNFESNAGMSRWNPTLHQWEITTAADYILTVTGTVDHIETGVRPDSTVSIYKNAGVLLGNFTVGGDVSDLDFFIRVEDTLVPSDIVYCEIESFAIQTTITLNTGTTFELATTGAVLSRDVQPAEWIPKIARKEFLTGIINIFNIVLVTDEIARTVTFRNFNDIFSSQEQDLTSKLDVGGLSDITPGLDSIARDSKFTWIDDEVLRQDFNLTIRYENDILDEETTVIGLPFAAADNSLNYFLPNDPQPQAKMPMVGVSEEVYSPTDRPILTIDNTTGDFTSDREIEFEVGDVFYVNIVSPDQLRVKQKAGGQSGQVTAGNSADQPTAELLRIWRFDVFPFEPRLANLYNSGNGTAHFIHEGNSAALTALDANSLSATWLDSLRWSDLVSNYYLDLMNAFITPQVVKAHFNLSIFDFYALDHLKPIYVDQYNAFFYLNKIEQFKIDNKTRLELVRISTITQDTVILNTP